jgi:hypothetical protein
MCSWSALFHRHHDSIEVHDQRKIEGKTAHAG